MQLDVAFYWADLPKRDLSRTVVAVADVLRATTVMIAALANGARAVFPQDRDEEARRLHGELSQQAFPFCYPARKRDTNGRDMIWAIRLWSLLPRRFPVRRLFI
jgi:hypothetical protein